MVVRFQTLLSSASCVTTAGQREKLEAYRARLAAATSAEADAERLRAAVRSELEQREVGWCRLTPGLKT